MRPIHRLPPVIIILILLRSTSSRDASSPLSLLWWERRKRKRHRIDKLGEVVQGRGDGDVVRGRKGKDLLRVAVDGRAVAARFAARVEVVLQLGFAVVEGGLGGGEGGGFGGGERGRFWVMGFGLQGEAGWGVVVVVGRAVVRGRVAV